MAADPLHGVTLEALLTELVEAYGWDELAAQIPIRCFQNEPSIASSLKFLRRTPWARAKVESFYLFHLREKKRQARRAHADDLRAASGLVVDATKGVVDVVEGVHTAIGAVPVITPLVYRAIREVTGLVGASIDAVVASVAPLLGESAPGPEREAALAVLNGVIGDRLEQAQSPLAIPMSLRPPLEHLHAGGTLLVLVHGSCMSDLQWKRAGHDHGRALARDLGLTPAYVHYNSGRHVSTNGAELAALLERESDAFTDIALVGHSMGGLVARAALHAAEVAGHAWRRKARALVTIATPHHGALLERAGNLFETALGLTRYSAPFRALGGIRSAGVTDLRFGNVVEADWRDRDRFAHGEDPRTPTPLPVGVRCCAIAASSARVIAGREVGAAALEIEPLDVRRLSGDGLVSVESALGMHAEDARTLRFSERRVVSGTNHLDVLSSPVVYELLRAWLGPEGAAADRPS